METIPVELGPWKRGWAELIRKMEIGSSTEIEHENDMRSFIQTMRTCGFRSSVRRKVGGGYTVYKAGLRPKMIWVDAWRNGVQVRKQVPEPGGEMTPVAVTVRFPVEVYDKLQRYCKVEETDKEDAILQIVESALWRHERYAG